ncbi:matrilysin-like [Cynoglossus semilaevis]|uniref:matrilysin-like n=1 Tax=Cynoglossus semilaevis TaxID=244447 RepID=UPI000D62C23A|nr:matrilysin-like [Cynoglossus semilaevis]
MGDLRENVHLIMELLWLWVPALVWVVLVEVAWTRAVDREPQPGPEDVELAENYLRKFYHFNPGGGRRRVRSASQLEEKMREMQNFFGLRETGRLNPETLEVMRTSRCGVPDVENFSFYPGKPKWSNSTITFTIAKYTPEIMREDVETSFRAALKLWSDAAPLKFLRVRDQSRADVVLSFTSRMHGDFSPFDGPGGVLAHAFQPGEGMGGDVHFDEDETWTTGSQGYSLSAVAAHELGHSLGLTHSRDPSAVMFPSYRYDSSTQRSLTMSDDDVHAIQTLYGKPSKNGNTQNIPSKCDPNVSFDAATMMGNNIIFFKNKSVWVRTTRSTYWNQLTEARGGEYFPGISSPVDAVFDIPAKGAVYIFTGTGSGKSSSVKASSA